MIQSMTGYGKASCDIKGKIITIEIRTLNSKQLDLSMRMPSEYKEKEIDFRNIISKELKRGRIDVLISFDSISQTANKSIDQESFENYHKEIQSLVDQFSLPQPTDWVTLLLKMPDVIRQAPKEEYDDEDWAKIESTLKEALSKTIQFRQQEGVMLDGVLKKNIAGIKQLMNDIAPYEAERIELVKERLHTAINALEIKEVDNNRFEQELIYYIEKLDINEEKNRLSHHLDFFIETLNKEEMPGKKLGFIAQEIGREINTMGSKSAHSEMQSIIVKMKDELEQIKEQILNIL